MRHNAYLLSVFTLAARNAKARVSTLETNNAVNQPIVFECGGDASAALGLLAGASATTALRGSPKSG